jgi:cytidylate kinase
MIVAIDGPAGSGKSTVARALAGRMCFRYLDTGAMYRCVALAARRRWGDGEAGTGGSAGQGWQRAGWEAAVAELAAAVTIELGEERVLLDGHDVTSEIRGSEISEMASAVAAVGGVRSALVERQRELVREGDWVAEGRDIGTVVAPGAELKVFLTADAEVRAGRRSRELGAEASQILREQAIRDARDSQREHSPLAAAGDAVVIDTTNVGIDEVVERIAKLAEERGRSAV